MTEKLNKNIYQLFGACSITIDV